MSLVELLTNLIGIFQKPELDFSKNRADNDDILGDAYEYLMRHFASESGKSKGQFYTPSEVSRVIAKVIGISPTNTLASTTAYDPTCGSGSLLLKVASEAGKRITLEGQEKDVTTAGLARMNMILHDFTTAIILQGNTLASPKFKEGERLRTYDYVVANPPFSDKTWSTGLTPANDPYQRFSWGEPPAKQGDFAYLLHIIRSMKGTGKAACILPHGVLFRGNAEATIREGLVRSGILKGIIGLPPNLFYGTGIPACILVLDKENASARKGVFMIDASRGFSKDGPKNRLRERDIHLIVDTFARIADVSRYARMVPFDEIASKKNDFNLNLPRYIDSSDPEDLHDIDAHLNGGIPDLDLDALTDYWCVLPGLRATLFESAGRPGYARLKVPLPEVKPAIFGHEEFTAFNALANTVFSTWRDWAAQKLSGFDRNGLPKELIQEIAERLLITFSSAPLIDKYDIYQHLMDYWAETMQDDCYLIAADGWLAGAQPREIVQVRRDNKLIWPEVHDYMKGRRRFKSDLVPASILVARYFVVERDAIEALDTEIASLEQQMDELREEHGGEEGLLAEVIEGEGERQRITAKAVKSRLKEIGNAPEYRDERKILTQYAELLAKQIDTGTKRRSAQEELERKIDAKYPTLTEAEIKTMVVEDRWLATITTTVQSELDRVSQTLTGRIRQLAERYATPLPQMTDEVATLTSRVEEHLKRMDVTCQTGLPRFNGEWEVKRLGDIAPLQRGFDLPTSNIRAGSYPVVYSNGIMNYHAKAQVPGPGVVTGRSGTIGTVTFVSESYWPHNTALWVTSFKGNVPRFVYYLYVSIGFERFASGSGVPTLNRNDVHSFEVAIPPTTDEQTAIVKVLSDMDAEIEVLEKQLAKTRAIKQGMMQELLTGKTRLITRVGATDSGE